jgi:hypothetical protein
VRPSRQQLTEWSGRPPQRGDGTGGGQERPHGEYGEYGEYGGVQPVRRGACRVQRVQRGTADGYGEGWLVFIGSGRG